MDGGFGTGLLGGDAPVDEEGSAGSDPENSTPPNTAPATMIAVALAILAIACNVLLVQNIARITAYTNHDVST